jgi:hypothetical protein
MARVTMHAEMAAEHRHTIEHGATSMGLRDNARGNQAHDKIAAALLQLLLKMPRAWLIRNTISSAVDIAAGLRP